MGPSTGSPVCDKAEKLLNVVVKQMYVEFMHVHMAVVGMGGTLRCTILYTIDIHYTLVQSYVEANSPERGLSNMCFSSPT